IIFRYGLDNEKPKTLEEIGKIYDLSRERIRQIENQALGKLKEFSEREE
ncbi:MAG: sigma factor-like helix-turn-helix DNA-binding protein, partial [Anaerococcus prevotii]